jgi:uncharacterized protein (DUF1778 family)
MARTGRPPIAPEDIRKVFPIRLSDDERKAIEEAAQRDGKAATTWARETLLKGTKL